jgi:hypothetical protein
MLLGLREQMSCRLALLILLEVHFSLASQALGREKIS